MQKQYKEEIIVVGSISLPFFSTDLGGGRMSCHGGKLSLVFKCTFNNYETIQ